MALEVLQQLDEMRRWSEEERGRGRALGFVPTMGYFHEGHMSLIRLAREACERVVVSIFVNPAQFGPREDFDRYPRDLGRDRRLAEEAGAHLVFVPTVDAMYPEAFRTQVSVRRLSEVLCGAQRPGHFDGVATIVLKLVNIVRPDVMFLGEKDYQQAVLLRRMIADLNADVKVLLGPTVREADGLAMSSRNVYLSGPERDAAGILYRALRAASSLVSSGETRAHAVVAEVRGVIRESPLVQVEYVSVVHPETLEDVATVSEPVVVALAARVGGCRLIDNITCVPGRGPRPRGGPER